MKPLGRSYRVLVAHEVVDSQLLEDVHWCEHVELQKRSLVASVRPPEAGILESLFANGQGTVTACN